MMNFVRGRLAALVLVLMLVVIVCHVDVEGTSDTIKEKYYESFGPYYLHDTSDTDIIVANGPGTGLFPFGTLSVFDDPLTLTPNINSTTVARQQGLNIVDSYNGQNNLQVFTMMLPNGTISGCSGPFLNSQNFNTIPCIGGTGEYVNVTRAYVEFELYSFNETATKFNIIVLATVYYHKEKFLL